jgi:hypothetical protein
VEIHSFFFSLCSSSIWFPLRFTGSDSSLSLISFPATPLLPQPARHNGKQQADERAQEASGRADAGASVRAGGAGAGAARAERAEARLGSGTARLRRKQVWALGRRVRGGPRDGVPQVDWCGAERAAQAGGSGAGERAQVERRPSRQAREWLAVRRASLGGAGSDGSTERARELAAARVAAGAGRSIAEAARRLERQQKRAGAGAGPPRVSRAGGRRWDAGTSRGELAA